MTREGDEAKNSELPAQDADTVTAEQGKMLNLLLHIRICVWQACVMLTILLRPLDTLKN